MSLRSLAVTLCILAISQCVSADLKDVEGSSLNPRRFFGFKPENAAGKINTSHGLVRRILSFLTSWTMLLNILVLVGVLFLFLQPGSEQGNILEDSGASLIMRIGLIIPGLTIIAMSIVCGGMRFAKMVKSTSPEDYIRSVQQSNDTTIMLGVTFVSILAAFLFVLIAGFVWGDNGEHGKMTAAVMSGLFIAGAGVLASCVYSWKFAKMHNLNNESSSSRTTVATEAQQARERQLEELRGQLEQLTGDLREKELSMTTKTQENKTNSEEQASDREEYQALQKEIAELQGRIEELAGRRRLAQILRKL